MPLTSRASLGFLSRSRLAPARTSAPLGRPARLAATLTLFGAAAVAVLGSPAARAADTYIGLGLGSGRQALTCTGYDECSRNATGSFKAFGGIELSPHLGVEVMGWKLGQAQGSIVPISPEFGLAPARTRSQGLAVSGVVRTQIDAWTLRARLGLGHVHGQAELLGMNSMSSSQWALVGGLGASYALDKRWSLHADWDRLPTRYTSAAQARADLYTVGVSRRF